jgi:putative endonuclease
MNAYYVSMMTNRSRVVLYTGVTNDLESRVWQHKHGATKGFTKRYKCDWLVYYEGHHDIEQAIDREKQIKGWTRAKKNTLVESLNPWRADLSRTMFDPVRGPSPSSRLRMTSGGGPT